MEFGQTEAQCDMVYERSCQVQLVGIQAVMNMLADAKKAALEKTITELDNGFASKMPWFMKMFTPCHGGSAIETMKSFEFAVPADMKDDFQSAYGKYSDAKKSLKEM